MSQEKAKKRRTTHSHKSSKDRHFANFVPKGLPWLWTHANVGLRHFSKTYSVPLIVTVFFLLCVGGALYARISQRSSLANLLADITQGSGEYGTLLSKDKTDAIQRNTDNAQPNAPANENPNGSDEIPGTNNPGNTPSAPVVPPPTRVFSAKIERLQQNGINLQCNSQKPKPQTCSKRYTFDASIRTFNGPGSVTYGWRSSVSSAVEDNNFAAGTGEIATPLQKVITLGCTSPQNFTLQLVILSPTSAQSTTINIAHNCNEL